MALTRILAELCICSYGRASMENIQFDEPLTQASVFTLRPSFDFHNSPRYLFSYAVCLWDVYKE